MLTDRQQQQQPPQQQQRDENDDDDDNDEAADALKVVDDVLFAPEEWVFTTPITFHYFLAL